MERNMPSSMVTAARASSSPNPGLTSQSRCTHSAMRTRSIRATRRRASSSRERYSLTKTSRRLPLRSCSTMAASMSNSRVTMGGMSSLSTSSTVPLQMTAASSIRTERSSPLLAK